MRPLFWLTLARFGIQLAVASARRAGTAHQHPEKMPIDFS